MNKLVLAAAAVLALSSTSVYAGNDPQGPETIDTGSLGEYFDPTTLQFSTTPPPSSDIPSGDDFAAVFADVDGGHGTYGEEWLVPYDPGSGSPEFSLIDDTADPLHISNAGFLLSDTLIPLDDLNDQSLPSGFTPLPALDGPLAPGAPTPTVTLPEPTSFWLAGLAAAAFAFVRRRTT